MKNRMILAGIFTAVMVAITVFDSNAACAVASSSDFKCRADVNGEDNCGKWSTGPACDPGVIITPPTIEE